MRSPIGLQIGDGPGYQQMERAQNHQMQEKLGIGWIKYQLQELQSFLDKGKHKEIEKINSNFSVVMKKYILYEPENDSFF